ncbi:hypothetical protein SVAN01_04625 [Stagonosporopsis vannaccii]|nr:hypothetical protein SVAN01_04625 [Stagonosporopsis vannaccii]
MGGYCTPPPPPHAPPNDAHLTTPTSLSKKPTPTTSTLPSTPLGRERRPTAAAPTPEQLKHDLLLLTAFPDNTTLHFRPAWFPPLPPPHPPQSATPTSIPPLWTLHNPPNVVTERLPACSGGIQLFTRRMRRPSDPAAVYIRDWQAWARYCEGSGVPLCWLGEGHVGMLGEAMGEEKRVSPQHPLYPEPPSPRSASYFLDPTTYSTHLPAKFCHVVPPLSGGEDEQKAQSGEVVVVHSDGRLTVSEWASGRDGVVKSQAGRGYRWSVRPWTTAMEESCRPLKVRVRGWKRE